MNMRESIVKNIQSIVNMAESIFVRFGARYNFNWILLHAMFVCLVFIVFQS